MSFHSIYLENLTKSIISDN